MIIFSGSTGHCLGLINFISANKMGHCFSFVSHLEDGIKSNHPSYRIRSAPAYLNQEFNQQIPLIQQLMLKAEDIFIKKRKADLQQLVSGLKLDAILLDNYNFTDALLLRELRVAEDIPVLLYQTRLSTILRKESSYGGEVESRFEFIPSREILKRQRKRRRIHRMIMPYFSDEYKLKKLVKKLNLSNVSLNYNRYGTASLDYLPEIILSNRQLSLYEAPGQYYMGLGIECNIQSGKRLIPSVLVSIGSRDFTFEHTHAYIDTISRVVRSFSRWTFYLPHSFRAKIRDKNARFYNWNEYQKVLPEIHLHITHGGINSIKDSLSYGIPMLICPMDWKSDQIHNALMFEKLGMARDWNLKKDDLDSITGKLKELTNGDYKEAICEFVERDKKENPPEIIRQRFGDLIHDERCQIRNW